MRSAVAATAAAVAVAGLAASAGAQSFTPQVGFRADHLANATPTVSEINTFHDGTPHPLQLLFGAFNAQGFTNRGMFNFIGTITMNDPAGAATLLYRTGAPGSGLRSPYNFGSIENLSPDGRTLTFDANRGAAQVSGLVWNFGEPAPAETYAFPPFSSSPANGGGPDTYFPGERFFVNLGDNSLRDITITVTGVMQAIGGWFAVSSTPPEDEFTPGSQDLLPDGFVSAQVTATVFIIHNVPAPSAAALLALGGLAAARRRR